MEPKLPRVLIALLCLVLSVTSLQAQGSTPFDQSTVDLSGLTTINDGITALDFGPDGRLYLGMFTGEVKILSLQRNTSTDYEVTAVEELSFIRDIVDHDDEGNVDDVPDRLITGITVVGTAANPVIYVASSDYRQGAGDNGGNGDINLDTNSGVVTRITWTGSGWDTVDMVRGLPRSEENHAVNGLQIREVNGTNYAFLAVGGITNGGAPSVNFVYTCEYALSAAIVAIDLDALNALPIQNDNGRQYIYDLPTVDDPSRPNVNGITDPDAPGYDGVDENDPWGGNDGLNMAIHDPNSPVKIVSPGYRNAYDLVITEAGFLYVTDNGANGGWGGFPEGEGTANVTNEYNPAEPGSDTASGNEQINNKDHLQLVTTDIDAYNFGSYYGGHPNPIRANPNGAGLYVDDGSNPLWRTLTYDPDGSTPGSTTNPNIALPANWPPVSSANTVEGDWRGPGATNPDGPVDGQVLIWGTNTNAITEYTASNFGGALQGNLLAGVNNGVVRRVELKANGTLDKLTTNFFTGIGGNALGLTANGDDDKFPGTVWVGTLNGKLVVFEPQDFVVCVLEGDPGFDPNADNDNDGYTNQDEIDNGTDYCSGGSQPDDWDKSAGGTLVSDLNDTDDDNDGIPDALDPFQLGNVDQAGSDAFTLPVRNDFFNDQEFLGGIFGLGLTGLMNNGDTGANWLNWLDRRDDPNDPNPNDVLGGAPGLLASNMTAGTANGAANTQEKGYQFGVQTDINTGLFTVVGGMSNFDESLALYGNAAAIGGELGYFIGDGTQSNFIKFVLTTDGFVAQQEIDDIPQTPITLTIPTQDRPTGSVRFYFDIDPATGVVDLQYSFDGGLSKVPVGTITAEGSILTAIQDAGTDLAVGLTGTSNTVGVELKGTYDFLNVLQSVPSIVTEIPDFERVSGFVAEDIDLTLYFDDDQGPDNLTFTVESNTNVNFGATINGDILTITYPSEVESTDITIRATDGDGLFVEDTFTASVVLDIVLFRVNAGGPTISSIDGDIDWLADTTANPTVYLTEDGSNFTFPSGMTAYDPSVDQATTPLSIYDTERSDQQVGPPNLTYSFPVPEPGKYEVRLYMGNGFSGTSEPGERIFDINIEGIAFPHIQNVDLSDAFGHQVGGVFSTIVNVTDGTINIELAHDVVENPLINGIEILDAPENANPIYAGSPGNQLNFEGNQLDGSLVVPAIGGDGNLQFEATGLPPGITIEPTNGVLGGQFTAGSSNGSPYTVTVTVDDSDGDPNDTVTVSFQWNVGTVSSIRVNAGGDEISTPNLGTWLANDQEGFQSAVEYTVNTGDISNTPGVIYANRDTASIPAYIDATTFGQLFGQERFAPNPGTDMTYEFALIPGDYEVRIFLANHFSGTSQVGQRVFDILLEGNVVDQNVDLITRFGHQVGGMLSYPVTIVDGTLDLGFSHVVENPLVSAIEIYPVNNALDAVALTVPNNTVADIESTVSLVASATGGAGGNAFTYFMTGQPEGISINPDTGVISGTVDADAATGGPNGDGVYEVKVTVTKQDSAPVSETFTISVAPSWLNKPIDQNFTGRHENSFVQAGNKWYLMGGRESARTIDIYDYTNDSWQSLQNSAPFEFNHFQATEYQGFIWVIAAFQTNNFPDEEPATHIWMFDPSNNEWIQGIEIPEARRRGGAGIVVYQDKFYILGGNTAGHSGGYVPWLDEFDPATGTWTALPDAPNSRDHFHLVEINGSLYAAGGRLSGGPGGVFQPTIAEVDVFDIGAGSWSTLPSEDNIPTPRGGASSVNYNNTLMVIGGEVDDQIVYGQLTSDALDITEVYDPVAGEWTLFPSLISERHGTQAIVSGDGVFIIAGSPNLGGGNQKTMEFYGVDNPQGDALVASSLTFSGDRLIADNSSGTINLEVTGGNTGIYIRDFSISGPFANDFSVTSGDLTDVFLKAGEVYPIEISLAGTGENRNATLTINYGDGESLQIEFSNSNLTPVISNPGDQQNLEGDVVSLQLQFSDDNEGLLTLAAENLPPSLTLDPDTGLISGIIDISDTGIGTYEEENGLVVIEAERAILNGGITVVENNGANAVLFDSDHFNNLNGGELMYNVKITQPGVYRFVWKSYFTGNNPGEANDAWIKLPNNDDVWFFGQKGNQSSEAAVLNNLFGAQTDIVFPKGSGREGSPGDTTYPNGSGLNGWFKVYRSGGTEFTYNWLTSTSDDDPHQVYAYFANPGTYTLELGERAAGFGIDKMVLYRLTRQSEFGFVSNLENTTESSFISAEGGAADGSPYDVVITATDSEGGQSTAEFTWYVGKDNNLLFAVVDADPQQGTVPLTVQFNGSNSLDEVGIASYSWDFGDGNSSTDANPQHIYTQEGTFTATLTVTDVDGNTNSDSVVIEVFGQIPPVAVAEATPTEGDAPLQVTFTGSNSTDNLNDIVSYSWDFGNGDTSDLADPVYTYATSGIYTATLTVTDGDGLEGTDTIEITVFGEPVAVATADVTSGNAPLTVQFDGSSSTDDKNDIVSYLWDFGTGTDTSTEVSPSFTFLQGGVYTVTLTVTDGDDLTDSTTIEITVNGAPTAVASADVNSGNAPLTVNFTGSNSTDPEDSVLTYLWDFGTGGDTSTAADPTFTFNAEGTYTVTLTVTDPEGLQSQTTLDIIVNTAPVAVIDSDVTSGNPPLTVNFDASNSTDDQDDIVSYAWDFGTGSATSTEISPSFEYTEGGTYTVTLTVTDGGGLTGTTTLDIFVNSAPVAVIEANPLTGDAPLQVQFSGLNSTDDQDDIASYEWDFGNGDTSSVVNPLYTYQNAGNFTATLTVTDGDGLVGTATVDIVVNLDNNVPPTAVALATPISGDAPLAVIFDSSQSSDDSGIVSYLWNFRDGTTSTEANPVKTFTVPGEYEVLLVVTDEKGLTDSDTVLITVTDPNANKAPEAVIGASVTQGVAPLEVSFIGDNSTDDVGVVSYSWDFGDGGSSAEANPSYTFVNAGTFTVTLTVTDGPGLTGTATTQITVIANADPVAVASASVTSGEAPLEVQFTGSDSTDDNGIVSYAWNFGDTATSTEVNPLHTYTSVGVFNATLTVTDEQGRTDVAVVTITVTQPPQNEAPVAVASVSALTGLAPLEITFTGENSTDDSGIASYRWEFGDGNSANTANAVHTYQNAGTYTAVFTVTDAEGLSDTESFTITVNSSNEAPVAIATASPISGEVPLTVDFDGSNSTDDEGIVSYEWDFDDGSPTSSLVSPTHTFNAVGTFQVRLTVEDAEGLSSSIVVPIIVNAANQAPVAQISASATGGEAPLTVNFSGSNSTDDKGIVAYSWAFGDGENSIDQGSNVSHTYTFSGTFEVVLTVRDAEGLESTDTVTIVVVDNDPNVLNELNLKVEQNPVVGSFARVRLENDLANETPDLFYLHDYTGKLLRVFEPQDIFDGTSYVIPIDMTNNSVYVISVKTVSGNRAGTRIVVQN